MLSGIETRTDEHEKTQNMNGKVEEKAYNEWK